MGANISEGCVASVFEVKEQGRRIPEEFDVSSIGSG
jgi:hypothetical protein